MKRIIKGNNAITFHHKTSVIIPEYLEAVFLWAVLIFIRDTKNICLSSLDQFPTKYDLLGPYPLKSSYKDALKPYSFIRKVALSSNQQISNRNEDRFNW